MSGTAAAGRPNESTPTDDIRYVNTATGHAHVGAQFGVVHGDIAVYQFTEGPPERQFEVGLNNLRAGAAREAERLIRGAFTRGLKSTRVFFYYALSVVSGKTINQVVQEDFDKLETAFEEAGRCSADHFAEGLSTVRSLIFCLIAQDLDGLAPQDARVSSALQQFDALSEELQKDIVRHLNMVLSGVIQDALDQRKSREIENKRTANDRRRRAIKFFIPDPARPIERGVREWHLRESTWIMLSVSVILLAAGGFWIAYLAAAAGSPAGWLLFFLMVGAAALAGWGGLEVLWRREDRRRLGMRYEHHGHVEPDPWQPMRPRAHVTRFSKFIFDCYETAFRSVRPYEPAAAQLWDPYEPAAAQLWDRDTQGIRVTLANETIWTYGFSGTIARERVEWLAYHHAREIAEQWRNRTFYDYRKASPVPPGRAVAFFAGSLLLGVAGLLLSMVLVPTDPAAASLAIALLTGARGLPWCRRSPPTSITDALPRNGIASRPNSPGK